MIRGTSRDFIRQPRCYDTFVGNHWSKSWVLNSGSVERVQGVLGVHKRKVPFMGKRYGDSQVVFMDSSSCYMSFTHVFATMCYIFKVIRLVTIKAP